MSGNDPHCTHGGAAILQTVIHAESLSKGEAAA
jgi:hypothetical protein